MSEELKNTDIGETSSGKTSKNTLKKVLKVLAWIAGVWLAILVTLQVALSPSVLTKVVNRFAAEYVGSASTMPCNSLTAIIDDIAKIPPIAI